MKYFNDYAIGEYFSHNIIAWEWSAVGWNILLPCYGFNVTKDGSVNYAGCNSQYAEYVNGNYKYNVLGSSGGTFGDDYYKVFEVDENTFLALVLIYPSGSSSDRLNNPPYNANMNPSRPQMWYLSASYQWFIDGVSQGNMTGQLLIPVHSEIEGTVSYTENNFNFNYLTLAMNTNGTNKYRLSSQFQRDSSTNLYHGYVDINNFTKYEPLLKETSAAQINLDFPSSIYIEYEDLGTTPSLHREYRL